MSPALLGAAAVFVGGGIGSVLRYALARWALASGREALWGTLAANVLACLLLGYLLSHATPPRAVAGALPWRLLLITGLCGGFSTFSTFSLEALTLAQDGRSGAALAYVSASLTFGLLAVGLGAWRAS